MEPADRPSPASLRHDGTVLPAPSVAAPPRTFVLFFASGRALRPSGLMLPGSDRLLPAFSHGAALWPSARSDRLVGGVCAWRKPKTLWEARKTLLWASGYGWLVQLCNDWLPANYLFLRAVPTGTPLEWLAQRGWGYYLCSLWLLAMVCLRWGCDFWNALLPRLTALTAAGNRSAYSRCTRSTSPCTNPDRGS